LKRTEEKHHVARSTSNGKSRNSTPQNQTNQINLSPTKGKQMTHATYIIEGLAL